MELVKLNISDKENSVKYKLLSNEAEVAHGYIFNREINPIEIYVEKEYQSNGFGKFLFKSLLEILKSNGLTGIVFLLDENNLKIINIIKKSGAVEVGRSFSKIKFIFVKTILIIVCF